MLLISTEFSNIFIRHQFLYIIASSKYLVYHKRHFILRKKKIIVRYESEEFWYCMEIHFLVDDLFI